jgi:hypothetical protein
MEINKFSEDFGDEPAIEERMDPFYTDEGIALLREFRGETTPAPIAYPNVSESIINQFFS